MRPGLNLNVDCRQVRQRALFGDVALRVTTAEGDVNVRYFTVSMAAYLLARYSAPINESGLDYQVERTEE